MIRYRFFKTLKDAHKFKRELGYGIISRRHSDGTLSKGFQSVVEQLKELGKKVDYEDFSVVVTWND